ncbi:Fructokinase-like 1 protein [Thalictrum thalictroides]|uniref:Fructokinase-like 1 protein n=1 Tax=Thalictrum thalictroides TaxID=46969 RepID=A0A7J6VYY4_THATH|nr:Fructokinase-like 1 protein [Thalictrum thalictroides]
MLVDEAMSRSRDRTEDFKDNVRAVALSLNYDESKLAAILASFIMHKPRQKSPFTKAALTTLESIEALEQFIVKHRKDYVDLHRTTQDERDSIEHEIIVFIKSCKEQIDILQSRIHDEDKSGSSKTWLGLRSDNSHADIVAHKHGVVLILSERLHSVTAQFDLLKGIRFQDAINRAIPRRKPERVVKSSSADVSSSNHLEMRETDERPPEPLRVQQQLLDDETRALQVELSGLLDAVQETETKMVEMSALNHLMSTHILKQAQQIELLYEQAVEATNNVEMGNKELSQAIQRNSKLQWDPPEFVRAPGGPPSNVAISHVRLGGRAAFMGKVGDDDFGRELVYTMNVERIQTRAVKFDSKRKTAVSFMKFGFEDGKMKAEVARDPAEDSLLESELNIAVLKEARIFHFNSEVLSSPSMQSTLYKAITLSKKYEGTVFFDLNLPLPLWRSRDETKKLIEKAWNKADIIEVSKQELEFLLDEDHYEKRRNYKPQYYAESFEQTKNRRDYYHYTREEISPLWHDGLKFLFVMDGTLRIHYYAPSFDGVVVGTEDVLITPFTCDRTGSGDAVVAGIMRKLTTQPEMFENQDVVERQLRFAIAAGIILQWTIGAVRGFPTESATQNLKEQTAEYFGFKALLHGCATRISKLFPRQ